MVLKEKEWAIAKRPQSIEKKRILLLRDVHAI